MPGNIRSSVGRSVREGRSRESDAGVSRVVDIVEPLEERITVDEVEAFARIRAEIGGDEVDAVRAAANSSVELRGGCMSIYSSFLARATSSERLTERGQIWALGVNS